MIRSNFNDYYAKGTEMFPRKIQLILLMFTLFAHHLFSNPLPIPKAIISEFKFESNGSWVLEISFQQSAPFSRQYFDSIFVVSSNGISQLKFDHIQDGTQICVITSDSLKTPLAINSKGDCIKLYSYSIHREYRLVDSVSFGNYPGAAIVLLQPGYSICRMSFDKFCKDKSPTIGSPNDTAGTCGIIRGHMYDKENKLITKGVFKLDYPIAFIGEGTYSTPVFSRKLNCSKIERYVDQFTSKFELVDSLCIDLEPDSVIEKDIHFKDYVVSVKENIQKQSYDFAVMNYPNPFNSSTNFIVKIPANLNHTTGCINIFNVNGEMISSISLSNNSTIAWNGKNQNGEIVSSGVYYYQLVLDNTVYKNGSVIFLK
jgi:hypothetical protein